jgi:hypothetical protein
MAAGKAMARYAVSAEKRRRSSDAAARVRIGSIPAVATVAGLPRLGVDSGHWRPKGRSWLNIPMSLDWYKHGLHLYRFHKS